MKINQLREEKVQILTGKELEDGLIFQLNRNPNTKIQTVSAC